MYQNCFAPLMSFSFINPCFVPLHSLCCVCPCSVPLLSLWFIIPCFVPCLFLCFVCPCSVPLLSRSFERLGVSWAFLGSVLGYFCTMLGRSWPLLGHSWYLLRALCSSWAVLGLSWPVLGSSWAALGLGRLKSRDLRRSRDWSAVLEWSLWAEPLVFLSQRFLNQQLGCRWTVHARNRRRCDILGVGGHHFGAWPGGCIKRRCSAVKVW